MTGGRLDRRPLDGEEHLAVDGRVSLDGTAARALHVGRARLVLMGALFALAYVVVGVRLVDVSLFNDGFEPRIAQAADPRSTPFGRRAIVDRNGVLLATNLPTASLHADPTKVPDPRATAAALARVLPGLDRATIAARLASGRRFVWIKRILTPRQQLAVNRLGLPGLAFQQEQRRVYPLGRLTGHVVGFVDIDNSGIAGIEKTFDAALRSATPVSDGPIRLSIDSRVQYLVRDELAAAMREFRAIGAAGLVLDANDGEVLAMVSLPDFDPNASDADPAARFNRATLGTYEMGSTFKVFTTAMALDAGVVTLRDGYDASKPLHVARFIIRDYSPEKRWLSVPEILIYSSNIGAAKMALDVGAVRQRDYLARFGLLRRAAIELPEVAQPLLPSPWREINTMTIGFGHGIAVSPLQLTAGVAAVVNGGIFNPPTLIARESDLDAGGARVISARTSARMRRLMERVVAEGTGRKAAVAGYLIGGKTGTADKPGRGGYQRRAIISSFVAAFPIAAPRYVVFAMLDEPKGTKKTYNFATGGWTAAPLVGRIIARLGPMMGLPPERAPAPAEPGGRVIAAALKGGGGVAF